MLNVVSFPTRGGVASGKGDWGASEDARFTAAAKGIGSGAGMSVYAKLSPPPREGSGAMQTPDACTNDVAPGCRRRRPHSTKVGKPCAG